MNTVNLVTLLLLGVTVASEHPYYQHHHHHNQAGSYNNGGRSYSGGGSDLDSDSDLAPEDLTRNRGQYLRQEGRGRGEEERGGGGRGDGESDIWSLFRERDYRMSGNPDPTDTSKARGQLVTGYTSEISNPDLRDTSETRGQLVTDYASEISNPRRTDTQTDTFPVSDSGNVAWEKGVGWNVNTERLHTSPTRKIGETAIGDLSGISESPNLRDETFKSTSQRDHLLNRIKMSRFVSPEDSHDISGSLRPRSESLVAQKDSLGVSESSKSRSQHPDILHPLKMPRSNTAKEDSYTAPETFEPRKRHSLHSAINPIRMARFVANPNFVHLIEEVDEEELERMKEDPTTTSKPKDDAVRESITVAKPTETVTVHYEATRVPILRYIWNEFVNIGDLLGREVLDTVSNRLTFLWRSVVRFVKSRGKRSISDATYKRYRKIGK